MEDLYQKYGEPRSTPVMRLDGATAGAEAPQDAVIPLWFGVDCEKLTLKDAGVQLSDFGEAFMPDQDTRIESHVALLLRPPEALFANQRLGLPADVWTLACTLYEVLGERPLFEGFLPDEDDILAEHISAIGQLPPDWWDVWEKRYDFFIDKGKWKEDTKRAHEPRFRSLAERVEDMGRNEDGGFSAHEKSDIVDMLTEMLVFRPRERIRAEELAKVRWMQNWGLPALVKLKGS